MRLEGQTAVVTGGAGLLGLQHALALAAEGARVALLDLSAERLDDTARAVRRELPGARIETHVADVTDEPALLEVRRRLLDHGGAIDALVNNAARNPKVESDRSPAWARLEHFPLDEWRRGREVGLTGALLCARVFGAAMAERGSGAIVNIASDLAVIAPDQRLYRRDDLADDGQPVKPVSYSVVKTGLLGLTRYLATYWADRGVRVNALSPGGVYESQPEEFVRRISRLIPLGRMARADEYREAIVFLCSNASSYMTGQNLVIDGGRSCW